MWCSGAEIFERIQKYRKIFLHILDISEGSSIDQWWSDESAMPNKEVCLWLGILAVVNANLIHCKNTMSLKVFKTCSST